METAWLSLHEQVLSAPADGFYHLYYPSTDNAFWGRKQELGGKHGSKDTVARAEVLLTMLRAHRSTRGLVVEHYNEEYGKGTGGAIRMEGKKPSKKRHVSAERAAYNAGSFSQARKVQLCFGMIRQHERTHRGGVPYDLTLRTRTDIVYPEAFPWHALAAHAAIAPRSLFLPLCCDFGTPRGYVDALAAGRMDTMTSYSAWGESLRRGGKSEQSLRLHVHEVQPPLLVRRFWFEYAILRAAEIAEYADGGRVAFTQMHHMAAILSWVWVFSNESTVVNAGTHCTFDPDQHMLPAKEAVLRKRYGANNFLFKQGIPPPTWTLSMLKCKYKQTAAAATRERLAHHSMPELFDALQLKLATNVSMAADLEKIDASLSDLTVMLQHLRRRTRRSSGTGSGSRAPNPKE